MKEKMQKSSPVEGFLTEKAPGRDVFYREVIAGLEKSPKALPCKYLYDHNGARLFARICELDEYYLTRTELAIMQDRVQEMATCVGAEAALIEYGSGEGVKTRILLDALERPAAYIPVDISRDQLEHNARRLRARYPDLPVLPVCADYTSDYPVPDLPEQTVRTVVYFPGSTVGNFTPDEAQDFLAHIRDVVEPDGGLLIGVDLRKDRETLERAYNDEAGVTAEFNLNLLRRINRELNADFDLNQWHHQARFNDQASRVELHLVSARAQTAQIGDTTFAFEEGETIHTENSYKYGLEQFGTMAETTGLDVAQIWTDPERLFSVQYLAA